VNSSAPLDKMVQLAGLSGHETVVDVGTGSGAIPGALSPTLTTGRIHAFDISRAMLPLLPIKRTTFFLADAISIPLKTESADLVTVRMVMHHLPQIELFLNESRRILRPGGRLIVCEYVPPDDPTLQFERDVFNIKEPGRRLWTGPELAQLVYTHWKKPVNLDYALMPQYSVNDWMGKSGLGPDIQAAVLKRYLDADPKIAKTMNIKLTEEPDAFVDRLFAFVVANK
jgi:SAM-dependent methyltransferase